MKNPRLTIPADAAPPGAQRARRTPPQLAFLEGSSFGAAGPTKTPDGLTKALEYLKFQPSEIARITSLVDSVASMASMVGFASGAISTAKQLLTMLGVLDTPEDPSVVLLKKISARVEQIYKYLEQTEKKKDYEKAVAWRADIDDLRNALVNVTQSRPTMTVVELSVMSHDLQREISIMLNPATGYIPFQRSSYGMLAGPSSHWVGAANPFYMARTSNEPVDYQADDKDLATRIWDPGFYFDIMVEAIALRLAALATLEPAFRSTGYDRENLRQIHSGLKAFLDAWNGSRIYTRIIGPLDPEVDPFSGGHRIHANPLQWSPSPDGSNFLGIPLGVIDPLSGVTAFLPTWTADLQPKAVPFGPISSYWVTQNYDGALASAMSQQSSQFSSVHSESGIKRLYELMHSVNSLIVGAGVSEFVDLSDPTFNGEGLVTSDVSETLDLGFVGSAAGQPGRKYAATRYQQVVTKTFETPMARRMDASQIQLGYRLVVDVGGPEGRAEVTLCPYSSAAHPGEILPLFPTEPIHVTLTAPAAYVYDFVQSAVFSANDEDVWERTGAAAHRPPPGEVYYDLRQRERLLVSPRSQQAKLDIDVSFEFDVHHPQNPFLGTAIISVTTSAPAGVVARVEIYETVIAALDNGSRDERQEELADTMSLHFASSFFVVEPDYFVDRAAGQAALEDKFGSVSEDYAKFKATLGPLDRVHQLTRQARVEQELERIGLEQMRQNPKDAKDWLGRLQVPRASPRSAS